MKLFITHIVTIFLLFCLGVMAGAKLTLAGFQYRNERTDTITRIDTLLIDRPVLQMCTVTRHATAILPRIERDTIRDTVLMREPVEVAIPIEQRIYRDSTYTAWVSGYMASLDSLQVYNRTETITITHRPQKKHWSVGFQGGGGFTDRRFSPYFGIGVSYNLFSW